MSTSGNEKWTKPNADRPTQDTDRITPSRGVDQKEGEDAPRVDIEREKRDPSHGRRHDGAIGINKEPGTGI